MDVFKLLRKTLSFKICWEIMKIEKSEDNLSEIGHFKALHSFGEVNESFGPFYFRIAFWTFPCYFVLSVFKTLWKSMDWILLYLCNWKFQFFFLLPEFYFKDTCNSGDSREREGTILFPLYHIHLGHKHSNICFKFSCEINMT